MVVRSTIFDPLALEWDMLEFEFHKECLEVQRTPTAQKPRIVLGNSDSPGRYPQVVRDMVDLVVTSFFVMRSKLNFPLFCTLAEKEDALRFKFKFFLHGYCPPQEDRRACQISRTILASHATNWRVLKVFLIY